MQQQTLRAGTQVLIASPANPPPPPVIERLTALIRSIPAITEAHLPHCHFGGADPPGLVLVLVVPEPHSLPDIANAVGQGLSSILQPGDTLNLMPVRPDHSLLDAIRNANCPLVAPATPPKKSRPWWKFW